MNKPDMEQALLDFHFLPRGVVESRHREGRYVAEVSLHDAHYVVSEHATYDDARQAAEAKAAEVKGAMLAAGLEMVAGLRKAKA